MCGKKSKKKFLYTKVRKNGSVETICIDDYKNINEKEKKEYENFLFCPDCGIAKLTYVDGKTPYFRTKRNSKHDINCGKIVILQSLEGEDIKIINIKNTLKKILSHNYKNSFLNYKNNSNDSIQKIIPKFKAKSLDNLVDTDFGMDYFFFSKKSNISLREDYMTYNFVRVYLKNNHPYYVSIKIKKNICPEINDNKDFHNIAFYGTIFKNDKFYDVKIDDPDFILID